MFGAESWVMNRVHEQNNGDVEMRMLKWMQGYTRMDMIRNENIREKLELHLLRKISGKAF